MATTDVTPTTGEVQCSYHAGVMTRLRCSRCGKPICPRCGVRTPVGLRCPDCAGVRGLPTYRTSSDVLLKSAVVGVGVAVAVGVLWGFIPDWNFYLMLLLGFGTAEALAWTAKGKRGVDLQVVGFAAVLLSIAIGRAVRAQRLDLTWRQINELAPGVAELLYLRAIPDGLFVALALAIVWYRFR